MNQLKSSLKDKRVKKYALIAIAAVVLISFAIGFSIEGRDSKLPDGQDNIVVDNAKNATANTDEAELVTVTLEIRCDTISEHMEYLENPSIEEYIPKDGTILAKTTYVGTTDNTVFDVLNALCRNNDIQLEFSYTPVYESNYIEGINFLYEFDGGQQSGWVYKVNDSFPDCGCSSYHLSDGDEIVWMYTCRGLGEDVGNADNIQ